MARATAHRTHWAGRPEDGDVAGRKQAGGVCAGRKDLVMGGAVQRLIMWVDGLVGVCGFHFLIALTSLSDSGGIGSATHEDERKSRQEFRKQETEGGK